MKNRNAVELSATLLPVAIAKICEKITLIRNYLFTCFSAQSPAQRTLYFSPL